MSVVVDKEILAPGDYHTREGVVHVTLDRLRHWHYMGRKMLAKGLQIPVPWEHQDAKPRRKVDRLAAQARHNAGFVRGYFLDADGKLWGRLEFADQATARHVKERVRFVSPEIDPRFTDGDGEEWQDVITHLAVTPRPVHFRQ